MMINKIRRRLGRAKSDLVTRYNRHVGSRLNTSRDSDTGFLYQQTFGQKVFLRSRNDYLSPALLTFLCRDIYFKFYEPSGDDVVVDIGAGYGHEAFYLLSRSPALRYFGVEVQPSIYEYLCNSFRPLTKQCKAIGFAVSGAPNLYIGSSDNYTTATTAEQGYIEVPTLSWNDLQTRYGIDRVDLLKVNIEGGERMLLPEIGDMSGIQRVVISAHDFRAEKGDGEHFRTLEFVRSYLLSQGYRVRSVNDEDRWLRNWLYADRPQSLASKIR